MKSVTRINAEAFCLFGSGCWEEHRRWEGSWFDSWYLHFTFQKKCPTCSFSFVNGPPPFLRWLRERTPTDWVDLEDVSSVISGYCGLCVEVSLSKKLNSKVWEHESKNPPTSKMNHFHNCQLFHFYINTTLSAVQADEALHSLIQPIKVDVYLSFPLHKELKFTQTQRRAPNTWTSTALTSRVPEQARLAAYVI